MEVHNKIESRFSEVGRMKVQLDLHRIIVSREIDTGTILELEEFILSFSLYLYQLLQVALTRDESEFDLLHDAKDYIIDNMNRFVSKAEDLMQEGIKDASIQ